MKKFDEKELFSPKNQLKNEYSDINFETDIGFEFETNMNPNYTKIYEMNELKANEIQIKIQKLLDL